MKKAIRIICYSVYASVILGLFYGLLYIVPNRFFETGGHDFFGGTNILLFDVSIIVIGVVLFSIAFGVGLLVKWAFESEK